MRTMVQLFRRLMLAACTCACTEQTPSAEKPPGDTETRFLIFGLDVDPYAETGAGAGDPNQIHATIDGAVAKLIERIGATGGSERRLGFMVILAPWLTEVGFPGKMANVIEQSFRVARARGVAVYFSIESHYYWATRPDLWNHFDPTSPGYDPNNVRNVEWIDWQGTPFGPHRYIDWGEPARLAPHMCYNSPAIVAEVTRLGTMIGTVIASEVGELNEADAESVFGGLTLTSELSLDDYSQIDAFAPALGALMTNDGAPHVRLGYCALTNAGYSEASPPPDIAAAAAAINQAYAAAWGRVVTGAGVPAARLYTHVAAAAGIDGPGLAFTNAPLSTAFNDVSRPGFTTYPAGKLQHDFMPVYAELAKHEVVAWAGTEAAPFVDGVAIDADEYLRRHFDNGAVVVVMNTGASGKLAQGLHDAVYGPDAIAAYQKFLSE